MSNFQIEMQNAVLQGRVAKIIYKGEVRIVQPRAIVIDQSGEKFLHCTKLDGDFRYFTIDKIEDFELSDHDFFEVEQYKNIYWAQVLTAPQL